MAKRVSLFTVLRRELGSQLSADGFVEVPQEKSERNSMLMYFREPARGKSLGFWFQRDVKSLCVDALGSSFTLEFFRSVADPYDAGNRKRAYFMTTPAEREEMRHLQNSVIKRLPPLESVLDPSQLRIYGEFAGPYRQLVTEPYNPRHDVWMRYRDEEDLKSWKSFVGRMLPSFVDRFSGAVPGGGL